MATWNKLTAFLDKKFLIGIYVALHILFAAFLGEVHTDTRVSWVNSSEANPAERRRVHSLYSVRGCQVYGRGFIRPLPEYDCQARK